MGNDLKCSISFSVTVLDGKRDRHAHAKQECGKNGVGESHHIFVDVGMFKPVGDVLQTGDVIHEEHEKHGECAEYINRGHSLRC